MQMAEVVAADGGGAAWMVERSWPEIEVAAAGVAGDGGGGGRWRR
jgi:hypothetical protein